MLRKFISISNSLNIFLSFKCHTSEVPTETKENDTLKIMDTISRDTNRSFIDPTKTYDSSPVRASGKWCVSEIKNEQGGIDFRAIDEVEANILEDNDGRHNALVLIEEEERWKHKLMFECGFLKTPKHLTWKELGEEIECLDCTIEPDDDQPEEIYHMKFYFCNSITGKRSIIFNATNDVSCAEGLTDFMAACGSCLGRADVHRTVRFDDGKGTVQDINIRKTSRYTSDVQLAFRPAVTRNVYQQLEATREWKNKQEAQGLSTWGFHPSLMDPEYQDIDNPEGTYHMCLSAHALSYIMNRAIERLISLPLSSFYRPSQVQRTLRVRKTEHLGIVKAINGWLGFDEAEYPHFTPMEAVQNHWLGADSPFTLTAIVYRTREMAYLKKKNPEFLSWKSCRDRDASIAVRNIRAKLLGTGPSTLFAPLSHNSTIKHLLPKYQQRDIVSRVSLAGMLGLPDETKKIDDLKRIVDGKSSTKQLNNSSLK